MRVTAETVLVDQGCNLAGNDRPRAMESESGMIQYGGSVRPKHYARNKPGSDGHDYLDLFRENRSEPFQGAVKRCRTFESAVHELLHGLAQGLQKPVAESL